MLINRPSLDYPTTAQVSVLTTAQPSADERQKLLSQIGRARREHPLWRHHYVHLGSLSNQPPILEVSAQLLAERTLPI